MSFIELWNRAAEVWSAYIVEAGWVSLVLLVVVRVVWALVKRRASAHTGFALLLLPLLPLVTPRLELFALHVPLGGEVGYLVTEIAHESPAEARAESPLQTSAALPAGTQPKPSTVGDSAKPGYDLTAAPAARASTRAWLLLAWLVVVLSLLVRFAAVQRRTQRVVRRARLLAGAQLARVRGLLSQRLGSGGLEYTLRFVESDVVTSPAAWGLRRPTIVLPPGLVARLDDEALAWMLLHEVAHLERRDMLVAGLQRVVQILWFFSPVVWLTGRAVDELRECACDEAALARSPNSKRRHLAEALLSIAAGGTPLGRPAPRLALQSLQKEAYLMKKRILRLVDPATPARSGLALGAVPLLLVLAGLPFVSLRLESTARSTGTQEPEELVELAALGYLDEIEEVDGEAQLALGRSLDYLLAWQRPDGHWPTGPGSEQAVGEFNVVGVTGWVLIALLQAEQQHPDARYRPAINKGLGYLDSVLDPETGLFGSVEGTRYMASHAVATRAWIMARNGQSGEAWKAQAQLALDAIVRARNPYAAWRFNHIPDGDNDAFMTSLMLRALVAARDAGFEFDRELIEGPLMFLDQMYDPESGRTGYNAMGSRPPRLTGRGEDFPSKYSEMVTGLVIRTRLELGQSPMETAAIRRGAALLGEVAPTWNRERGTIDYYSWAFGSEALARLGGYQLDYWRAKLIEALVEHQRFDAEGRGWWPAVDAWSGEGATVHSTVMCTLALQAVLD